MFPSATEHDRRCARWVFWAFLCLYVTTGRFILDHSDGEFMFENIVALTQGRLDLNPEIFPEFEQMSYGLGGKIYSPFGIGQPVLALPLYVIGLGAAKLVPQVPERAVTRAAVMLFNPLVTALACAVIFMVLRGLGLTARQALAGTIVFGVATPAWPYTKTFFSNPLAGLLVLLTAWGVYRARWHGELRAALWAGIWAGIGLLTRHQLLFAAALGGLILLVPKEKTRDGLAEAARTLLRYGPSVLIALGLWGWHNYVRYGEWTRMVGEYWQTVGGSPLWKGLAILFISPGKGLVWYAPVCVLAPAGFVWLWRQRTAASPPCPPLPRGTTPREEGGTAAAGGEMAEEASPPDPLSLRERGSDKAAVAQSGPGQRGFALCALAMMAVSVGFYSILTVPGGHWCWGPRFLVDILPLLAVTVGVALSAWPQWGKWKRGLVGALIALSVAVQLLGCSVNFMHTYRRILDQGVPPQYHEFEWRYSPITNAAEALVSDLQWTRLSLEEARAGSPSREFRRSLRATLDYWPVYAWRVGAPWWVALIFVLQLVVTGMAGTKAIALVADATSQVSTDDYGRDKSRPYG